MSSIASHLGPEDQDNLHIAVKGRGSDVANHIDVLPLIASHLSLADRTNLRLASKGVNNSLAWSVQQEQRFVAEMTAMKVEDCASLEAFGKALGKARTMPGSAAPWLKRMATSIGKLPQADRACARDDLLRANESLPVDQRADLSKLASGEMFFSSKLHLTPKSRALAAVKHGVPVTVACRAAGVRGPLGTLGRELQRAAIEGALVRGRPSPFLECMDASAIFGALGLQFADLPGVSGTEAYSLFADIYPHLEELAQAGAIAGRNRGQTAGEALDSAKMRQDSKAAGDVTHADLLPPSCIAQVKAGWPAGEIAEDPALKPIMTAELRSDIERALVLGPVSDAFDVDPEMSVSQAKEKFGITDARFDKALQRYADIARGEHVLMRDESVGR
jgi:hypothetical protein